MAAMTIPRHAAPTHNSAYADRRQLTRFAALSIGAALLTIALKTGAYWMTGSVGLLSDALESGVNLFAAVVAFGALSVAARPPDADHTFGHDKAEYFSSAIEGLLIVVAALLIIGTSAGRLFRPEPLAQVGIGVLISAVASVLNLFTARVLLNAGKRFQSITLDADGKHLMSDVWTSAGVILALIGISLTGWAWLDPVIAFVVAAQILFTGWKLLRRSAAGLMDTALPPEEQTAVESILKSYSGQGILTHALLTRQSGARRFISLHLLVPRVWTVSQGHALSEQIESRIRATIPNANVLTHLEPLEEPISFADVELDRTPTP